MADIIDRLRDVSGFVQKEWGRVAASACLATEAAAEIERLRAALEEIAEMTKPEVRTGAKARPYAEQNIHFLARAALTAQPAEGENA